MNALAVAVIQTAWSLAWVAGIVLAPGWWKALAVFFPPYAWYLVAERLMQAAGWLA